MRTIPLFVTEQVLLRSRSLVPAGRWTRRDLDELGQAWAEFQREHADEIPPRAPKGDEANRLRQRALSRLYMRFLEERGNPFLRGRGRREVT